MNYSFVSVGFTGIRLRGKFNRIIKRKFFDIEKSKYCEFSDSGKYFWVKTVCWEKYR